MPAARDHARKTGGDLFKRLAGADSDERVGPKVAQPPVDPREDRVASSGVVCESVAA
jgi:hypothetical protein